MRTALFPMIQFDEHLLRISLLQAWVLMRQAFNCSVMRPAADMRLQHSLQFPWFWRGLGADDQQQGHQRRNLMGYSIWILVLRFRMLSLTKYKLVGLGLVERLEYGMKHALSCTISSRQCLLYGKCENV